MPREGSGVAKRTNRNTAEASSVRACPRAVHLRRGFRCLMPRRAGEAMLQPRRRPVRSRSRALATLLSVLAALGLLSLPRPCGASLVGPSVHGLAAGSNDVVVRVGKKILFFDHEGNFRREVTPAGVRLDEARLLTLTDDGRLWVSYARENADGGVEATTLVALDDSGAVAVSRALKGDWSFHVTPRGAVYAGQVSSTTKRLGVVRLDAATGRTTPHAAIPIDKAVRVLDLGAASAVAWAVDDSGDLFVLTTAAERGRVTRYHPSGDAVRSWDVLPDPVTSVSYIKDVILDRDGVPYVTHSSWEVSSAAGNSGSVLRLDPAGGEPLRIKEGIGYLQHAAVAPAGDVFVVDLSEEVARYAPTGERLLSWVAVPPKSGDTWEGRRRHIEEARRAGPDSTLAELVNALVYGDWDTTRHASRWLLAKGAGAVAEVTAAVAKSDGSPALKNAAEGLWDAHPDAAARLFLESRDEAVRRALALHLAWKSAPPAGVRELLNRLALAGDEEAADALGNVGLTPEMVAARIGQLRRAQGSKADAAFDAKWDLTRGYAESIGALEAILRNPRDPQRILFRDLILEASLESTHELDGKPRSVAAEVVARTGSWSSDKDPLVSETAAIALTAFGVAGHEAQAIGAAARDASLARTVLRAFAGLARAMPEAVASHVPALLALARAHPASEYDDVLADFAEIPQEAVRVATRMLIADPGLPVSRRATVLSRLRPESVPRAELLRLLGDPGWQRPLVTQYSYHSFVEAVVQKHPQDAEVRGAVKDTLLALLAEAGDPPAGQSPKQSEARAILLGCLAPLVTSADGPRITALLADPGLSRDARWQALRLVSRIAPDEELRARLVPLLRSPDERLAAAQALGRAGDPAALAVLIEDGLKKLGYYSSVDLDVDSFRPLGAEAEQALIGLLDYPNEGTRRAVRLFLAEWPSMDGRRRMRADFDRAIEVGQAPRSYDLEALAVAGESIVDPLVDLALKHPDAIEDLAGSDGEEGPLDAQIRAALSRETDPDRAAALRRIEARLCRCF
ncbi:MAG: hypothetical protein U0599_01475 [Vicinamibacteria bacterium]